MYLVSVLTLVVDMSILNQFQVNTTEETRWSSVLIYMALCLQMAILISGDMPVISS